MSKIARQRLDDALVARGLAENRSQARALIMAGAVRGPDRLLDKPGMPAPQGMLRVSAPARYVSRGGLKLERALAVFGVDSRGLHCADLGASTGGFTDCLLRAGAAKVYAVDVGYGQLHWDLRNDPRVVAIERTNARHLDALPGPVQLVVADLSFISLALILPAVNRLLERGGRAIVLVKPQFEAGRDGVGKGGVVRDPAVHRAVLARFVAVARAEGFGVQGLTPSPLKGPAGNIEFLALLTAGEEDDGRSGEAWAAVAMDALSTGLPGLETLL